MAAKKKATPKSKPKKKESKFSERSKIHSPYYTSDGTRVSGVTTVLNVIAKPALIYWAWDLGIKGIDYKVFRDELGDVGTLAHEMILAHIQKRKVDTGEYGKRLIDMAKNAFKSYLAWEKQHTLKPLLMEKKLVSEIHRFGGRFDYLGPVDDVLTLMDFKTGERLYDNIWYQMAGYDILLRELFPKLAPKQFMLLNIGRSENEQFEQGTKQDLKLDTEIFMAALKIYQTEKRIKKGE